MRRALVLFIAVVVNGSVQATFGLGATFYSGNYVHSMCNLGRIEGSSNTDSGPATLACASYIVGVFDATSSSSNSEKCLLFRPPERVQVRQIVDVARKYLNDNPARRSDAGADIVIDAFIEAWPCPPKESGASSRTPSRL